MLEELLALQDKGLFVAVLGHKIANPPLGVNDLVVHQKVEGAHHSIGRDLGIDGHFTNGRHSLLRRPVAGQNMLQHKVGELQIDWFVITKFHQVISFS